ncbi:MAG TPA: hypothetical protein VGW78_00870 [Candidatus Babeliales bacterium]|jgi:hypothetical protein|nr:hypothetical protein [Candidatus Babeliales bacterium]
MNKYLVIACLVTTTNNWAQGLPYSSAPYFGFGSELHKDIKLEDLYQDECPPPLDIQSDIIYNLSILKKYLEEKLKYYETEYDKELYRLQPSWKKMPKNELEKFEKNLAIFLRVISIYKNQIYSINYALSLLEGIKDGTIIIEKQRKNNE